jgi:hypothetical protein
MVVNIQTVEELAGQLSFQDQQLLLQGLRHRLIHTAPRAPRSLKGLWKSAFPSDVDIETVIREIRNEWKTELDDFAE